MDNLNNSDNATFTFIWRRTDKKSWHVKRVMAASPEAAFSALQAHFAKKDVPLDAVVVDHIFYIQQNEDAKQMHSLIETNNPFTIEYRNTTWAPDNRPKLDNWPTP